MKVVGFIMVVRNLWNCPLMDFFSACICFRPKSCEFCSKWLPECVSWDFSPNKTLQRYPRNVLVPRDKHLRLKWQYPFWVAEIVCGMQSLSLKIQIILPKNGRLGKLNLVVDCFLRGYLFVSRSFPQVGNEKIWFVWIKFGKMILQVSQKVWGLRQDKLLRGSQPIWIEFGFLWLTWAIGTSFFFELGQRQFFSTHQFVKGWRVCLQQG